MGKFTAGDSVEERPHTLVERLAAKDLIRNVGLHRDVAGLKAMQLMSLLSWQSRPPP